MGLFNRLTGRAASEPDNDCCPYCGTLLQGWECVSCKVVFVSDGGRPVEPPPDRSRDDAATR